MTIRSKLTAAAGCLILAAAALFRAPDLAARPFHGDEAVNAFKYAQLRQSGRFLYDPYEYHGPTLSYSTRAAALFADDPPYALSDESDYRWVVVCYGTLLAGLTLLTAPLIGRPAAIVAALLVAASPSMVFYSRYYIHEMPLVFFAAAMLAAAWRWSRTGSRRWAVALGLSIGLMHATKETFILSLGACGVALLLTGPPIRRWLPSSPLVPLAAAAVSIVFFSAFFSHWTGVIDSVRTYLIYLHRGAGGEGTHNHEWWWYWPRFFWHQPAPGPLFTEWPVALLALIGLPVALRHGHFHRFIALYTLILAALYSALSYKTPWCFLNVMHPMMILAGIGASWLVHRRPHALGLALALVVAALVVALTWQCHRLNFAFGSDRRNPHVYGHPVADVRRLADRVIKLLGHTPPGEPIGVKVTADGNYWPLPFYLRAVPGVEYEPLGVNEPSPTIVIVDHDQEPATLAQLKGGYQVERFGLRPGELLCLIVRQDLWNAWQRSIE